MQAHRRPFTGQRAGDELIAAAALGIALFEQRESRVAHPVLGLRTRPGQLEIKTMRGVSACLADRQYPGCRRIGEMEQVRLLLPAPRSADTVGADARSCGQ